MLWNFFEFWVFLGNQSYCVLFLFFFFFLFRYYYWFPGLVRKGTYKFTLVRAFVRAFVPAFRSYSLDHSIFFSNFLHKVVSPYDLDDHKKNFGRKNFWPPKWLKMVKIWPFLAKIAIFECFWPVSSKHQIFHNFWYGNYLYGFLWENHSVYAGKILVRPLGGIF